MNFIRREIFPNLSNVFLDNKLINNERLKLLSNITGNVLEIGIGSGLNLIFYPNEIQSLTGIDPSHTALKLAYKRSKNVSYPVKLFCGTITSLNLPLASFDFIVTTWVLCMIDNPVDTISQFVKHLKPEGKYCFLEHGYSDNNQTMLIQNILNPINKIICGGCNINRPITKMVESSGFKITEIDKFRLYNSGVFYSTVRGIAIKDLKNE